MTWPMTLKVFAQVSSESELAQDLKVMDELIQAIKGEFLPQEGFQEVYAVFMPVQIPWLGATSQSDIGFSFSSSVWSKGDDLITLLHPTSDASEPYALLSFDISDIGARQGYQERINQYLSTKTEEIQRRLGAGS